MNFDEVIDRRGTHSMKWDMMHNAYGVSVEDGLPMWVADMDFRPPSVVQRAVEDMAAHGVYGYFGDEQAYLDAVCWWSQTRHGWTPARESIFSTNGLVNGIGLCIDALTAPGDGIVLMTPVYHAFGRVIRAAGRTVVECPLKVTEGRQKMDFDGWDALMTGRETMLILCSPHNPGGRVWTEAELRGVVDFCRRHSLFLLSDEIHRDLIYPGHRHISTPLVAGDLHDRLIVTTAATKTFNIAGAHVGNVIISDAGLRDRFRARMLALGTSPNAFGLHMATAAFSPEGAAWVDALMVYLDGNRRLFDAGLNAIPGVASTPLEATYLAWVDFAGTGMTAAEVTARVEKGAGICTNHGSTFGAGGETFLRFNIGTQRTLVVEAVERMQKAFADLQ